MPNLVKRKTRIIFWAHFIYLYMQIYFGRKAQGGALPSGKHTNMTITH